MIEIVTSLVQSKHELRNSEFMFSLFKNSENPLVDAIHILTEDESVHTMCSSLPKKIIVSCSSRPTFKTLADYCNTNLSGKVVAITNADIFFDNTLSLVKFDDDRLAYCLTRWDPPVDITVGFDPSNYTWWQWQFANMSFDTYIFKPPISATNMDFDIGVLGCDQRFSYELYASGLHPINPAKLIRTFHVHKSSLRTYDQSTHIGGKYLRVDLSDSLQYNVDCVSEGWLENGHISVYPKDWDWLPRITDEEFFSRTDIPTSMRQYYPCDRNGRRRRLPVDANKHQQRLKRTRVGV